MLIGPTKVVRGVHVMATGTRDPANVKDESISLHCRERACQQRSKGAVSLCFVVHGVLMPCSSETKSPLHA
jgi:hypothetical protein